MACNPEQSIRIKQDIINNLLSKTSLKNPVLAKEIARKWACLK